MRIGVFFNSDWPSRAFSRDICFCEEVELAERAESLGFDEAWIVGEPFAAATNSAAGFLMLSELAARTATIRLGALALASPWRNPTAAGHEIERLDLLSGGRLALSIAAPKGSPTRSTAGQGAGAGPHLAGLERIRGRRKLRVAQPQPIATYIASSDFEALRFAARHGCGVMADPLARLDETAAAAHLFRGLAPARNEGVLVRRFFHLGATHDQAVEEAANMLAPLFERAFANAAPARPAWTPWFQLGRLIADSLVGTIEDVRAKIRDLERRVAPTSLILEPVSADFAKRQADMALFARRIRSAAAVAA